MRILLIHNIYRPYKKGGAEVVFEAFVDELKKEHEVVVFTAKPRSLCHPEREVESKGLAKRLRLTPGCFDRLSMTTEGGVNIIRFAPRNIFSIHDIDTKPFWMRVIWHAVDVWNPKSYFVMKKILREIQPDVVWTHSLKGIGYLAFLALRAWKNKVKSLHQRRIRLWWKKSKVKTIGDPGLPPEARRSATPSGRFRNNIQWILTPHNEELVFQFGYARPPFQIGLIERMTMLVTCWLTKGVDLVFAPSRQIIEFHQELGFWKGARTSSDWPVFTEFKVERSKPNVQDKYTPFTFGFLGQLEEHKGVLELIRAFRSYGCHPERSGAKSKGLTPLAYDEIPRQAPHLSSLFEIDHDSLWKCLEYPTKGAGQARNDKQENCRLLIAGRGTLAARIQSEIKNDPRIRFWGEYRTEDLPELFSQINVLVVPSTIRDNMPTVILESFAHGRPVIGSNLGGIHEILVGGGGILLEGLSPGPFHRAFDEIQKPETFERCVDAIHAWKPFTVHESLQKIGLFVS